MAVTVFSSVAIFDFMDSYSVGWVCSFDFLGVWGGGCGGGGAGGGWLLLFFRGWLFLLLWIRVRLVDFGGLGGCILLILWGFGVLFLVR